MGSIDEAAKDLQQRSRNTDQGQIDMGVDYSEQAIRIATIHTREDQVLLVSYLSSIAKDIRIIQTGVTILTVLAIAIAIMFAFRR